jgi:cell division protein FtsB
MDITLKRKAESLEGDVTYIITELISTIEDLETENQRLENDNDKLSRKIDDLEDELFDANKNND